jgi:uncharacterized protein YegL
MAKDIMDKHRAGHFGFSAVKLQDLGAPDYTLVNIVADRSGSTGPFQKEMETALKEILNACQHSPRADNLMLRVVTFENTHKEVHGYKLLNQIDLASYDGILAPGGMTALYDASVDAIEACSNYGKTLMENEYPTNGITFVLTDGLDNQSKFGRQQVKEAMEKTISGETLESHISVLIGVGTDPSTTQALQEFKDQAGFTQFVVLADATKKNLAKLAQFVSQSISSQSQALGSGGPSQTISF